MTRRTKRGSSPCLRMAGPVQKRTGETVHMAVRGLHPSTARMSFERTCMKKAVYFIGHMRRA